MIHKRVSLLLVILLLILSVTACTEIVEPERPIPQEKMMEWSTYENTRFNYQIKYPKNWEVKPSQNNDGIQLIAEEEQDIRVYASNVMNGSTNPMSNAEAYQIDPETIELNSGQEAHLINGEIDDQHLYELVVVSEDIEYHFVAKTSVEFFNDNRNILEQMVYSFNITEQFTAKRAVSIEKVFHNLVFKPQLEEGSYVVSNFDTKEALINEASKYASQPLVADYVDDYYTVENNQLKVIPTEAPATIIEGVHYQLNQQDDGSYKLIQTNNSELYGEYELTIVFKKINGVWKITDRNVDLLEDDK